MESKFKILLAEDEYLCAIGLENHIKALGHEVIGIATTGKELISMATSLTPDLIISDINMPKPNGLEALKAINNSNDIPAIITSSYNDTHIDEGSRLGIYYYLIKPIQREQLHTAIKIAMSRHRDSLKLQKELSKVKESLKNRKVIDQAKSILVTRNSISEEEAMQKLQLMSKNKNKKLITIADEIIKANDLFLSFS